MSINKRLISTLKLELGSQHKQVNKGEVLFKCPFCHHHKLKMSVNLDPNKSQFGYWKCWVCDQAGKSLWTLLGRVGMSGHTKHELTRNLKSLNRFSWKPTSGSQDDEKQDQCLSLPKEFKPLWRIFEGQSSMSYRYAINYLKKRGIGMGQIIKYRLGWCDSGKYENRIVIPSYDENDQLNYFTARDFQNGGWLKYMNPDASRDIVPFENITSWVDPIILTEGPFDAIAVRRNAIPLFGKTLSTKLKQKLFQYKPPAIYILLDQDAFSYAIEMAEWMMNQDLAVYLADPSALTGQDPGDTPFQDIMKKCIGSLSEPLDFQSLVHYKLMH